MSNQTLAEYLALEIQMLHTDEIYKLEVLEKILQKKIDEFSDIQQLPNYNNSDPYLRNPIDSIDDLGID